MAPKDQNRAKDKAKSTGKGAAAKSSTTSTLKFVAPGSVLAALQARADRAHAAILAPEESLTPVRSLAQEANWHATQVAKASKRLEFGVKAKAELAQAGKAWFVKIAEHLGFHLADVARQGQQLDQDMQEALDILSSQAGTSSSSTTQELLSNARASLGSVWSPHMPDAVRQVSTALRNLEQVGGMASGATWPPRLPPPAPELSTFGNPPTIPKAATDGPQIFLKEGAQHGNRWSKRSSQPSALERPVKSPRTSMMAQDLPATHSFSDHMAGQPPWSTMATGRTPPKDHKPRVTLAEDTPSEPMSFQQDEEIATEVEQDWIQFQDEWVSAWNAMVKLLVDKFQSSVPQVGHDARFTAVLPEPPFLDPDEVEQMSRSTFETLLRHPLSTGPEIASAVEDIQQCYRCLRCCPDAVVRCPIVVLVMGHVLQGAVQDVHSFSPRSVEEYLYPELVLQMMPDMATQLGSSTSATPAQLVLQACACPFSTR